MKSKDTNVYLIPAGVGYAELEVKKSRFLGTARYVSTPEEVKRWVRAEWEAHPRARHVVHAYLIGPPNSEIAGMHDDGEPRGTAGRPVLEVIRGSGIRNVLVIVTRYFGGTLLGTGGLVRAYGDCAKTALANTPTLAMQSERTFRVYLPYEYYDTLIHYLAEKGFKREEVQFLEEASFTLYVPQSQEQECLDRIRTLCHGKCRIEPFITN